MKGDVAGEEGLGVGGDGVGLGEIQGFHNGGCDAEISQGLLGAVDIAGGDKHLRTLFEEDADCVETDSRVAAGDDDVLAMEVNSLGHLLGGVGVDEA